jgi:hypothetical protein
MFQSRPLSSLLLVSGIVSASWACSSGGENPGMVVTVPTAGTGSTSGGSDSSGGTGSPVPTAGTTATTGGTDSGQAGSQASAGSGGMIVGTAGTGGAASGGTGGSASGGTGGSAAGGSGGSGGGSGGTGGGATGFCGSEAGKVVLFDGSDATFKSWYPRNGVMNAANPWTKNADGSMTVKGDDIVSKMGFQNVCLHVEYQAPKYTYPANTNAQERGNSGVYLKGSWEAQVLDTFDLGKTQNDYCGAIYKVAAPLVSACKTGGEWNAYDIEFQANVCTGGTTTTPAKFLKVNLNGVNVQNNVVVPTTQTEAGLMPTCDARGILLQNHSSIVPVSFRNIWAIPRP